MKAHNILSDGELLANLDNDKYISSDEEFDVNFDECNYGSDGRDEWENEGDQNEV